MTRRAALAAALAIGSWLPLSASGAGPVPSPELFGIPFDFVIFAAILLGVALFHHHTLAVALIGLSLLVSYKLMFTGFKPGPGLHGLVEHLQHESVILINLLGLLLGFSLLAKHFEDSGIPAALPRFLPHDWRGAFLLLVMIFVLSSFLDNIAAAMIGGAIALTVFRKKVHIGYLAAIVAASNAGGSGSVVGDTTTTMMWIDGVPAGNVLHAYLAAGIAVILFGIPAAIQQQRYSPVSRNLDTEQRIDWARVAIVAFILGAAIVANVIVNLRFSHLSDRFPFIGAAVWVALLVSAPLRRPDWALLPSALVGSVFLLSLIVCASLMPVERLPVASWQTAFGLGFVSSVFDNSPLTALALKQGGYDWGFLAYAVGFGGSMIWFGSSAGVALSNMFPEAKSALRWLRHGWHVALAYVIGFFIMLVTLGWVPAERHRGVALETVRYCSASFDAPARPC